MTGVQDTAGALEFHNSYALAQDSSAIPARDFTIMVWAKTPAWTPDLKDEVPYYQTMLTYATHAQALRSDSTPGVRPVVDVRTAQNTMPGFSIAAWLVLSFRRQKHAPRSCRWQAGAMH